MWFLLYCFTIVGAHAVDVQDAVVLLVQGRATCAGTLIDERGWIVTSYHCVAAGGRPGVQTRDGRRTVSRVISARPGADIAILEAPALAGEPVLEIRKDTPEPGEEIRVIGHPFGVRPGAGFMEDTLRWSISTGVVSTVGTRALQISAPLNPGNSGGPVVDGDGRLVGVVSRRLSGQGVGFATRAHAVQALLDAPRAMGPLGGAVSIEAFGSNWSGDGGTLAVGARLELAFRDRIVAGVSGAYALNGRWEAMRFGTASWSLAEGRVGLRARFLRGYWSGRAEIYGGAAVIEELAASWRSDDPADGLEWHSNIEMAPMVGGSLGFGNIGLDSALIVVDGVWTMRFLFIVRWPGVLAVF